MPENPSILVIGSLNIDFVTTTPRVPSAGETLTATSLTVNAGGKGANQAVACGRAAFTSKTARDVNVSMVGAVGVDDPYYASLLRPTLEESGVNSEWVKEIEGSQTGTATILVEEGSGENRIMVVPGANHDGMREAREIIAKVERSGRTPDVVVMQGEIPRTTTMELLKYFNGKRETKVVFNPAPVFPEGVPKESLQGLAMLVVNESENFQLFESLGTTYGSSEDVEDTCKRSSNIYHEEFGIEAVVITLGKAGAFYSTYTGVSGMVDAVEVSKVVDTTAAGDTFVGVIATELARAKDNAFDLARAVAKANTEAAKTVQVSGAMASIPFGYET